MRLADYSRHTTLFLHQLVSFINLLLFSVSCAAILRLKNILLVLIVWDLEKNITLSYTIVERNYYMVIINMNKYDGLVVA